jgi:DNA-binding CsgD family transcriptional regulator
MTTAVRPSSPRRETELRRSIARLLSDARDALGGDIDARSAGEIDLDSCDRVTSAVTAAAVERLRSLPKGDRRIRVLSQLALRAEDVGEDLRGRTLRRRTELLTAIEHGIARLRPVGSSAALIDRICEEVVRSCGFTRALLTRIEDNTWLPWMAYFSDDREFEREYAEWMNQTRFPLDVLGIERLLLERRRPILVRDALADPRTFKPMIERSGTRSYVAAPIVLSDHPIGFLYADHYPSSRPVDEIDRDVLGAFAESFTRIYERTVLLERLHDQRDRVRQTLADAESVMDDFCNAEIEIARHADERSIVSRTAGLAIAPGAAVADAELTPREHEVLELMVAGQANSAIAERLVITEGTVKSHVKHILRKLGAANRSEAIARYMGLAG